LAVELIVPKHLEGLTLGIVVGARQSNNAGLPVDLGLDDFVNQPPAGAHVDELTDPRRAFDGVWC
jgi:hypothetical protein